MERPPKAHLRWVGVWNLSGCGINKKQNVVQALKHVIPPAVWVPPHEKYKFPLLIWRTATSRGIPVVGWQDIKIPHDGHEQQLILKLVPDTTIFSKLWITCIAMACFGVVRGIATGGRKNTPDAKIRIVMNQTYRILRYLSGVHY